MREFTLRNKATKPILTLTPTTLKKLLEGHPESTQLVLGKYRRDYKELTGKVVGLDHEQETLLLKRAGANEECGLAPTRAFLARSITSWMCFRMAP